MKSAISLGAVLGCLTIAATGAAAPNAQPADGPDKSHWAFRPVQKPPVPRVQDGRWPSSPIDYFIRAKLEANGLAPAPPADRRTLIRRATYDLIGLPPTIEEVETFAADNSPDAFAQVVDRLLDSPHYGQRWGRY